MVCQKCKTEGVFVKGLSYQFFYCRNCKTEIDLEIVTKKDKTENDFQLTPEGDLIWDGDLYYL